jgi:hypothetical protein
LDATATPVAGDPGDWTLLFCTLPLDFGSVESLDIRAETIAPGWRVILVEPSDLNTPGLLNASNNRVELTDLEGKDEAIFLLGTQRGCSAFPATTLQFEITGERAGASAVTSSAEMPIAADPEPQPEVTLQSISFNKEGDTGVAGTLTIAYTSAPPDCPWQLLVTLDTPAVVTVTGLTAPEGTGSASATGLVSLTIPAGTADGVVTLQVAIEGDLPASVLVEAVTFP